ncbi:VanZ family protein [Aliikangiella sp. IMCC44359]|uniref:VanZ family protein n=1 Tax=Aliikangiella sp. IMCC44359 TaxID=3459125 RepID=UPI00403B34DD
MLKSIFTSETYQSYWKLLFWIILAALLYLTLTPKPPQPISFHNIDKLYHFAAFGGFTFVFGIAFSKISYWYILLVSILLGIAIEVVQIYVPNRGFSIADMLADFIGVIVGIIISRAIVKKQSSNKNR